MTTTNNNMTANTTILSAEETSVLFQGSDLVVEDSLKNLTDNIGGKPMQYATFDAQGRRTRESFLNGVGTDLKDINSLEAALKLSGLDFTVEKRDSYVMDKKPGKPPRFVKDLTSFKLVRTDTGEILNPHVGPDYQVYQNFESFDFLDSLTEEGAKFETACLFGKSKTGSIITPAAKVMICMSTPEIKILDDDYKPYLMFLNSFDKTLSLSVQYVPFRIYCANCVNRAKKQASDTITIRHTKNMQTRLDLARMSLVGQNQYFAALAESAEKLALLPFSEDKFLELIRKEYPQSENNTNVTNVRNEEKVALLMQCYREDDLANFRGTAWGAIQAIADFTSHAPIATKSSTLEPQLMRMRRVVDHNGNEFLNATWNMFELMV